MKDSLITNLKKTITGLDSVEVGEMFFKVKNDVTPSVSTTGFTIYTNEKTISIDAEGTLYDRNGQVLTLPVTVPVHTEYGFYCSAGAIVKIKDKYDIIGVINKGCTFNINDFAFTSKLNNIQVTEKLKGSLEALSGRDYFALVFPEGLETETSLDYLDSLGSRLLLFSICYTTNLSGNISVFENCSSLQKVNIYNCPNVIGDISVFSNKTSLQRIHIGRTAISGHIEDLVSCTGLSDLFQFDHTNIDGSLGTFLDNLHSAGKTSGYFYVVPNDIVELPAGFTPNAGTKVTFSASGWSI